MYFNGIPRRSNMICFFSCHVYFRPKPASPHTRCVKMNSNRRIYCITILFVFASAPLSAQWKLLAPNLIIPTFRPYNSGGVLIFHDGILWAGFKDVWMSADTGKSWSKRTPFKTMLNNSCIRDISFYNTAIGLATTQNGEIFITQDQGLSWARHVPANPFRPFPSIQSACFCGTANNIIACSYAGDRYVSSDGGTTWAITLADSLANQVRAGSGGTAYLTGGFDLGASSGAHLYETNDFGATWFMHPGVFGWDSYSFERDRCDTSVFYIANDELAAKTDKTSRIFISTNTGASWSAGDQHPVPHHCGSISAASNAIFVQTYSGISRSTDQGNSWKNIGGPPNTTDTRFVAAIDNNIIVAIDTGTFDSNTGINGAGSVWITFNGGGDSLTNTDGNNLSLVTSDQHSDTIGGSVAVPISLNGIGSPIDIELILHYDPQLIYKGTYSTGNIRLDLANKSWLGRSRINIPGANSSGILAYAYFDVFNDSSIQTSVTFDSVIYCSEYTSTRATSIITPASGCGSDILTRFIRDSTFPNLVLMPNPTTGDIYISSSYDLGEAHVIIYDMAGVQRGESTIALGKNIPAKLILPVASGVYSVRIASPVRMYDLRVVVDR